jgi:glycosyltransferase involved in cell wall biosynthesis
MRVLQLVPSADSPVYRGQVCPLERYGVDSTTLEVPGDHTPGGGTRSPRHYLTHFVRAFRGRDEFDLVHANQGVVAPTALTLGLPTVLSLWGTDLYGGLGPVSRLCSRLADEVVVMSPAMATDLGVDCRVIPHGVDTERFCPGDQRAARDTLGWGDGFHVLFPYAPERVVKNYSRAERIVDAVGDRLSADVSLHAVTGVPHERMPTYYVAADALLLPSDHEGSPNAVKEALACNLPVVSTPVGDVPERLAGVTPSATASTDAGLTSALAAVLARDERSNGRAHVSELTLEHTARRLAAVYRDVLDR